MLFTQSSSTRQPCDTCAYDDDVQAFIFELNEWRKRSLHKGQPSSFCKSAYILKLNRKPPFLAFLRNASFLCMVIESDRLFLATQKQKSAIDLQHLHGSENASKSLHSKEKRDRISFFPSDIDDPMYRRFELPVCPVVIQLLFSLRKCRFVLTTWTNNPRC